MSRATFVYIVMLTLFGAGLWAILSFGSILLHAPEDLAGKWELFDARPPAGANAPKPSTELTVEQSGRYFNISFNGQARVAMKLIEETTNSLTGRDRKAIRLVRSDQPAITMHWNGIAGGDEFEIRLTGPHADTWIARRTRRTYPVPPARRSARPETVAKASTTSPTTSPAESAHAR